jgi:ADP-ribose pyrophosphatase YjhB (NUDIX family)
VVPKWTRRPWFRLLRNFRLIDELPAESSVFTCLTGNDKGLQGTRQEVGPTRWPTQVYADNTDYVRFLPQKLRNPQKTYWTHAKIIITDGRRVLLRRENSGWIWFPGGERRTADATPESTIVREVFEIMGYKIQESQLRRLGTESSTPGTKDYVFLYRVRPGSVPDDVPSDRVVWATWKELTKARSTGYLATGNHIQYPLRHEYFGKPIDEYINPNVRLAGENPTSTLCMSGSGSKLLTLVLRVVSCVVSEPRVFVVPASSQNRPP